MKHSACFYWGKKSFTCLILIDLLLFKNNTAGLILKTHPEAPASVWQTFLPHQDQQIHHCLRAALYFVEMPRFLWKILVQKFFRSQIGSQVDTTLTHLTHVASCRILRYHNYRATHMLSFTHYESVFYLPCNHSLWAAVFLKACED